MKRVEKLLVVDDDRVFGSQLASILTDLEYEPVVFNSGRDAIAHLKGSGEHCIVLLDVQMPGMDGVEVVRAVRDLPSPPSVVLMTAHASLQTAIECMRLGAKDYITKPFDLDLLLITLERVAEREELRARNSDLERMLNANEHEFRRSQAAFSRLAEILSDQTVPRDFPQTSAEILGLIHELLHSQFSSICVRGNESGFTFHFPEQGVTELQGEQLARILDWVGVTGRALVNGQSLGGDGAIPLGVSTSFPNSIFHPIRWEERCFGAVHVSRAAQTSLFGDAEVHLVELLCAQISVLYANAKLYENHEKMTIGAITSLANAAECKDGYTAEHSRRSRAYLSKTLETLGLSRHDKDLIGFAIQLHDIGKIRVPNQILNKPGPLTDEEWDVMRMHPVWGYEILNSEGMLSEVATLVKHHHERFDGKGYPDHLTGRNIPLGSRIMCIVDAFDAMRSNRPYRDALPMQHALGEIRSNLRTQFDPEIGEAFLACTA